MDHDEASELLGAVALDAVGDEREALEVKRHMLSCQRCREEFRRYAAVARRLGSMPDCPSVT